MHCKEKTRFASWMYLLFFFFFNFFQEKTVEGLAASSSRHDRTLLREPLAVPLRLRSAPDVVFKALLLLFFLFFCVRLLRRRNMENRKRDQGNKKKKWCFISQRHVNRQARFFFLRGHFHTEKNPCYYCCCNCWQVVRNRRCR